MADDRFIAEAHKSLKSPEVQSLSAGRVEDARSGRLAIRNGKSYIPHRVTGSREHV